MTYTPSSAHIERYASLLVNFALGDEEGIKPGETVCITCPENAKPLYVELCRAVWRAGGNVISRYEPADEPGTSMQQIFYELASDEQLVFCAERFFGGLMAESDHLVYVASETDPHALGSVDPTKMMRRQGAMMPVAKMQLEKEGRGELTWTIALYGTEAMAAEAKLSIEEYWGEIIAACFLDDEDPIARWREVEDQLTRFKTGLNALPIDRLHVEGADADLWLTLGERRRWVAGSGRNIPSFEVFTSPDWRRTEGWIRFSEPLYTHGSLITGIELEFREGRVVRGERRGERGAAEGDDRRRERRPGRRVLADRRAAFADPPLHGEHALRREHGRRVRQHARRDRHVAPGHLRRRPDDRRRGGVGAARIQHGSRFTPTSSRRPTEPSRRCSATAAERVIYAGGQFQLD